MVRMRARPMLVARMLQALADWKSLSETWITPVLSDSGGLGTSPRIWPGLHPGKPCTLAPTSTDHPLPDPRGVSIPTADEPGASAPASRRRWHTVGRLRLGRR